MRIKTKLSIQSRTQPSVKENMSIIVPGGMEFDVLTTLDGWYKIRAKVDCWVESVFCTVLPIITPPPPVPDEPPIVKDEEVIYQRISLDGGKTWSAGKYYRLDETL